MSWTKKNDVAQFKGADWNNFIQKEANCTPAKAKIIAWKNPDISFFFFCNEGMVLEGPVYDKYGPFNAGDAVFFSGEPWYGSAPQCDAYEKQGQVVVYASSKTPQDFEAIANYKNADGSPAVDIVCIFAANFVLDKAPYLCSQNDPTSTKPFNQNIQDILDSGAVKKLQDQGIAVLMTIIGGHHAGGWSNFSTPAEAKTFVQYIQTNVVDKYGLDGIDIDDEYSSPDLQIPNSLVTVTSIMQELMPTKLVTKALFADQQYFDATYNGKTLGQTLDYGWEMSYGGAPSSRLPFYVGKGMAKNKCSLGFWVSQPSYQGVDTDVQWLKSNGFDSIMVFAFNDPGSPAYAGQIVDALEGPGNWNNTVNAKEASLKA